MTAPTPRGEREMHSTRGRLAATALAAVIATAGAVLPFTSGGALNVDDGGEAEATTTTLPGGGESDLDVQQALDDAVDGATTAVEETVASAPEPIGSSSTTSTTSTTTTTLPPADEEVGEEEQPSGHDGEEAAANDGVRGEAPAKETEPASRTQVEAVLYRLRTLDEGPLPPEQPSPEEQAASLPRIDFVDVPLGPRSTGDLVQLLGDDPEVLASVLAPFPVAGAAHYSNDWGRPRHGPGTLLRTHQGTDIFADRGTPVIASGDGVVSGLTTNAPLGGISLRLTLPTGTFMYYAHLEGFGPGIRAGAQVSTGEVIGYVGTSGNAEGTPPHLHFQIHPGGGEPVPPLPYLDGWLADARERAGVVGAAVPGTEVALGGGGAAPGVQAYQGSFFPAAPASASGSAGNVGPAVLVALAIAGALVARRRFSRRPAVAAVSTAGPVRAWWNQAPEFGASPEAAGRRARGAVSDH